MKKKLLATLLTLGAFCCSAAAFAGCNINDGTEGGGGGHTSHTYQNYQDNGNGTCTGTCTGCEDTDTIDHVYDNATDTTCNNCGHIREVGGGNETVSVTKVMINKSTLSLEKGQSETLTATVLPENATDRSVSWSSDNESIATVDANGKVTAKAAGTAHITVTTADGNKTKTCTVTVSAQQQQPTTVSVTGVEINKTALPLKVGENQTLTATVSPSNATNKEVGWSSDNESVATVDDDGKVTAKAAGTAVITVTTADGNFKKTCTVTVTANQQQPTTVSVTGVELNKTALPLKVGENQTLTATVSPANATNKEVGWSSDNESVAAVGNDGKVTAKAVGTAVITVTTADGSFKKTCTVTVTANQQQPSTVSVTGVNLDKTTLSLAVGDAEPLVATVLPANATNKNVSWSSSNTAVATVNASGDVTAKATGTTTITVTTEDGSFKKTCLVTVSAQTVKVTAVSLNKSQLSLLVNDSEQLTVTVSPNNAANKNVTWSSNNDSVATVDVSGNVTAHKAGTAVITVTTADGNKTATCTVTVSNRPTADVPAAITYSYAGEECAAFEWNDTTTTGTKAEYKLHSAGDGTYKQIDSELIRLKTDDTTGNTYVRADIVGLKGGEVYDFRLTTSAGNKLIATNMSIYSYDRSGYAHFNASTGVGGYNDDGTLKNNAIVVYVNEDNKNNVVVNGSATNKSIVQYLGSMTNNTKPIVVRILGTVGAATWNKLEHNGGVGKTELYKELVGANGKNLADFYGVSKNDGSSTNISQADLIKDGFNTLNTTEYAELKGLSSKIKFSPKINSKGEDESEFDSAWNDCSLQYLKNVTVEGIGTDARIFQWGFTWKLCDYIEVRNLTFEDYTEDACSFEGSKTSVSSESQFDNRHFWIHHNVFEEGMNYWDVCNEQDKHDGDGSTDFKGLSGVTVSYNVYHDCHKTGLVGGSDTQTTANVTFHHNYYNHCGSRLPLARQANMHMYNNYYYKSTGTNMSIRAGGYALIENCYFDNANVPIEIKTGADRTGAAKVLDCTFEGKNYTANSRIYDNAKDNTINRASEVENDNRFNTKFDTDPTSFYYDGTNLRSNVSQMMVTASVKTVIPQVAGVQKRNDDFTLAITGNNAPCGVKQEGGDNPALTKFEELSARADCAYSNDFDKVANGTKFDIFENYSTAGIYSMPNEAAAYSSNHTAVTNGKAVQVVTNEVNTTTAIAFGSLAGKSSVEGYFEMSTSDIGTKWDLIRFVNSSSSVLAAVRINTDKAAKLTYYTESTESGPSAITPSKSFVWAANTTYKVYFAVDLTSGQINISITGSGATFEATIQQSATDICGINILSSNKGARRVTIDNLVICAV